MIITTIALTSIVFLAALLTFAGISKLLALDEFAAAIVSFGPPTWSGKPLGLVICLAEIWASALLLFMPSALVGVTTAAILFAVFGAAIACNLALGRTPGCRCFGQTSTEPISWRSFARVLGLLALAVALAWKAYIDPTFGVRSLLASLDRDFIIALSVIIILGGAISVLSWSVLQLFRQNGKLLIRVEALEKSQGTRFPDAWFSQISNQRQPAYWLRSSS